MMWFSCKHYGNRKSSAGLKNIDNFGCDKKFFYYEIKIKNDNFLSPKFSFKLKLMGYQKKKTPQLSKNCNNFNQNNIRKALTTAAVNTVYHTCYTKFFYLLLGNNSNGSFQKLRKIIDTCKIASLL